MCPAYNNHSNQCTPKSHSMEPMKPCISNMRSPACGLNVLQHLSPAPLLVTFPTDSSWECDTLTYPCRYELSRKEPCFFFISLIMFASTFSASTSSISFAAASAWSSTTAWITSSLCGQCPSYDSLVATNVSLQDALS